MIRHYPYHALGQANYGWLKSRHHFSFAHYHHPDRMKFGALRVINDDWVRPGTGFDPHPHRNMEIISYIRSGAIFHNDSEGNQGVIKAGEIQVMSAGTGILHSEYNLSDSPLIFYQIWIETNKFNAKPRWQSKAFPVNSAENNLPLLVSGFVEDKDQVLFIHQEARIYGGRINKGKQIKHSLEQQAYILAADGEFELSSQNPGQKIVMAKGDGAEITKSVAVNFAALTNCEVLVIDVPLGSAD